MNPTILPITYKTIINFRTNKFTHKKDGEWEKIAKRKEGFGKEFFENCNAYDNQLYDKYVIRIKGFYRKISFPMGQGRD